MESDFGQCCANHAVQTKLLNIVQKFKELARIIAMSKQLDSAVIRSKPPPLAAVKIVIVVIFGRTDLRISVSEAKFDEEADFEVHRRPNPLNPDEKRKKPFFRTDLFRRKKCVGENFGSKISFFAKKTCFLRIYGRTDLKISFLVKFCSRLTYPEVCTSKNHRKRTVRKFCLLLFRRGF